MGDDSGRADGASQALHLIPALRLAIRLTDLEHEAPLVARIQLTFHQAINRTTEIEVN